MLCCPSCGDSVSLGSKFCSQCATPISQNDQNISILDGVVAGDVHQTSITNIHHSNTQPRPYERPEDIKLSWWGVYVTRSQYFLCYWFAIGFVMPLFVIGR
ncbi:MAG: zinc-ribbon domain-containing protein, partial [Candidatus Thermoplasmatota archaeon]|nr:zinc-ribbon domain-containing protein [Candidatus Thermoplasmatota archaeon]